MPNELETSDQLANIGHCISVTYVLELQYVYLASVLKRYVSACLLAELNYKRPLRLNQILYTYIQLLFDKCEHTFLVHILQWTPVNCKVQTRVTMDTS